MEADGHKRVKSALGRADKRGNGRISKELLVKVLQEISGEQLSSDSLNEFVETIMNTQGNTIPISAFVDFVFQRYPGLPGAEDIDLSLVFECIDKNGNGVLEKQEVIAAAQAKEQGLTQLCQQIPCLKAFLDVDKWQDQFNAMDTNSDGVISWFEFVNFFAHSGTRSASASNEYEDLLAVFACIDRNGNGALEKNEVLAAAESQDSTLRDFCQQVPALKPLLSADSWRKAFDDLDTNKDGVVSWHEFAAFFMKVCAPKR